MKIKTITRVLCFLMVLVMMASMIAACKNPTPGPGPDPGPDTVTYDTEKHPLVMSILELDGNFNPFYSTSGTDNSVWGMTQVSMFDTDPQGNAIWGGDRSCLALDFYQDVQYGNDQQMVTNATYTDYTYVLKPNAKFSDGTRISVKDVLFGYYVNLDPVYTGASTMYSTEILGLNEYRTQNPYIPGQDSSQSESAFNKMFEDQAEQRADQLIQAVYDILERDHQANTTQDKMSYDAATDTYTLTSEIYNKLPTPELKADYKYIATNFYKELETDYNSALSTDLEPSAAGVRPYPNITDARQYFLYMEGLVARDKDDNAEPDDANLKLALTLNREQLIQLVFNYKMPGAFFETKEQTSFYQIVKFWATGSKAFTEWTAEAKGEYLLGESNVDHIYGITWNKQFQDTGVDSVTKEPYIKPACYDATTNSVTVNGNTYPLATYDSEGNVQSGFEVINIRIKKIDPKAVWNFASSVVPMHYYSSPAEVAQWDGYTHFGVSYANTSFYTNFVKEKTVPMGAGVYKATTSNGPTGLSYTTFYSNNVVHYERNEYFYTLFCDANGTVGSTEKNAKIKYFRYQIVNAQQILNNLITGAIDYADPNATQANIDKLNKESNLSYTLVDNLGYGYVGVNAGKPGLESVYVRRAIMRAMDTTLVLNYYSGGLASNIWYPMSKVSWAYPDDGTTATSFRYAYDKSGVEIRSLLDEAVNNSMPGANYSWSGDGKFCYNGSQLKLTFTIAGSTDDHPAYNTMKGAADLLNTLGLKVEVKNDSNTLKKLTNGELQVWAAAWGSGIDPDMYQVYHIDSTATSVTNWGYREIKRNSSKYSYETALIETLSEKIDKARETLVQAERKEIYAECLDLVLELAVELPLYQRKNMFVYNNKKIDASTLVPPSQCTPYQSPMAYLWEVDYVK